MRDRPRPRVVVLGGGFAGLNAVRALARAPVDIVLLDRRNHHLFQPLLYQVATAGLSSVDIAAPLRRILRRQRNVEVRLGAAQHIDVAARRVVLAGGGSSIPYDHLIVATGATHAYFGHPDWAAHAPGLKSIEDALEMRRRILLAYETAESEPDAALQQEWLTFVVIGAGPTGVELAGAIAEIARHTLTGDFRRIDSRRSRVLLLEGAGRVLPGYPADLSAHAAAALGRLGVEVRTGTPVTGLDASTVQAGSEVVRARTVLWAAGVAASPLGRSLGAALDGAGRVLVRPDLTLAEHPEIAVIGDLAALEQEARWLPGVAQVAIQQGRHAGANVRRALQGRPALPFHYTDKGSLATIGRRAAVADFGRIHLAGFPAWAAWIVIHIYNLIGFRNRVVVLFEWALAYLTYQRNARIILTGPVEDPSDGGQPEGAGDRRGG